MAVSRRRGSSLPTKAHVTKSNSRGSRWDQKKMKTENAKCDILIMSTDADFGFPRNCV